MNRKLPVPPGSYLPGDAPQEVADMSKVHTDEYEVRPLDFTTVLPKHVQANDPKRQSEYMMQEAANELAHQLLHMEGIWTIGTQYVTETEETRVNHRIKVLVIKT